MAATRVIALCLVALVVGVAIGYALPYALPFAMPSAQAKPAISLSADTVKTGEEYTAEFSGFPANTEIYGWTVNEEPPRKFEVGTTDANGKLEVTVNAPQTPGDWLLVACDGAETNWATAKLTVTEP